MPERESIYTRVVKRKLDELQSLLDNDPAEPPVPFMHERMTGRQAKRWYATASEDERKQFVEQVGVNEAITLLGDEE